MEVRSFEAIINALNGAGARYIIVGGIAVNAHGFVRMTRDVDIVLELKRDNILTGINALFEIGYQMAIPVSVDEFADPQTRERWRDEKNMIVLKLWSDRHGRTPIDIFIYEPFDFIQELGRVSKMELSPGIVATIVSLESLLAMKREASRPQDLIDIEELLRIP
ncbi:MAG: nucleotidyl transferase AbiEii/AbiGii toxin family protein [Verrucomicrobiota bacterium]